MVATNGRTVTVFGGTGFLGRRVVRHLRKSGFPVRIASRHLERAKTLFDSDDPQLQSIKADIHNERSIADALVGAYAAVNAVSLYVEHGQETFHSVHVESARRVTTQAYRAGVQRLEPAAEHWVDWKPAKELEDDAKKCVIGSEHHRRTNEGGVVLASTLTRKSLESLRAKLVLGAY